VFSVNTRFIGPPKCAILRVLGVFIVCFVVLLASCFGACSWPLPLCVLRVRMPNLRFVSVWISEDFVAQFVVFLCFCVRCIISHPNIPLTNVN